MKNVKLNQEQQSALEQIKQGGNYIILGNAGTGKSTLLRHLHDAIPEAVFVLDGTFICLETSGRVY